MVWCFARYNDSSLSAVTMYPEPSSSLDNFGCQDLRKDVEGLWSSKEEHPHLRLFRLAVSDASSQQEYLIQSQLITAARVTLICNFIYSTPHTVISGCTISSMANFWFTFLDFMQVMCTWRVIRWTKPHDGQHWVLRPFTTHGKPKTTVKD